MIKIYKWLFSLILLAVVVNSCTIINPQENVPTYIHIDSFRATGVGSHEITSVVVYYNNNPIGSFDLPVTFPVMANGSGNITVYPGIAPNGQNDQIIQYPFYSSDTFSFTAAPGTIKNYTPVTKYVSVAKFYTISDFEFGQINISKATGSTVGITGVTDPSLLFEGNGTGSILMTAAGDSSIDSSNAAFPIKAGAAFIEFDYKTTVPFAVGLLANYTSIYVGSQYYIAGINPNTNPGWRKFYLNVTGYLTGHIAESYNFFLKTSLPSNMTSGRVLIDNVKLVTF